MKINNEKFRIPYLMINNYDDLIKKDEIIINSIESIYTNNEKIFVVDDNKLIRNATSNIIKKVLTDLNLNDIEIIE